MKINELKSHLNIAEELSDEELAEIGMQVKRGFEIDEESRSEWYELVEKAMDIAKQTIEKKNTPWPNASNVKFPLITKAAIDFAARTYPELVQNERVVKAAVIGNDPDGSLQLRATRVSKFMSYQLLFDSDDWEVGLDNLLHILPVLGTVFKKTYYDPLQKRPVSELCRPDQIVVNYNIQSLKAARRISHVLVFHCNDIIERVRSGLFLDVDMCCMRKAEGYDENDDEAPFELIEQHCFLDLDEDGYQEPYVVTIHKESGQVLRIVSRFKNIERNKAGEIKLIEPEQYFIDYHFIKAPDGGFYSVGLGPLLYPLNEAVNTLLNQLIDAGTLNNQQSGFLGKGLRLKNGQMRFEMGTWEVLDAAPGTSIQQNVFPLPTKEPSDTLLKLLGVLIDVGKDLIAAQDVLSGKGQTQNVAATTVMAMVEQGLKVFNSIHKRVYKSLRKELQRMFELNSKYLTDTEYRRVMNQDDVSVKMDFNLKDMDVFPVADPNMASDAQRMARAEAIMKVPGVDPVEAAKYYLQAIQIDASLIEKLLPPRDPKAPPPPEVQKILAETGKLMAESKAVMMDAAIKSENQIYAAKKLELLTQNAETLTSESAARIMKMKQDAINSSAKVSLAGAKADHQAIMKELDLEHQKEVDKMELAIQAAEVSGTLAGELDRD